MDLPKLVQLSQYTGLKSVARYSAVAIGTWVGCTSWYAEKEARDAKFAHEIEELKKENAELKAKLNPPVVQENTGEHPFAQKLREMVPDMEPELFEVFVGAATEFDRLTEQELAH
mmetsp:Transcript_5711/g.14525  ORF Transcript_5711/g.14525 Transcript_5711/m.14525 type:complete len:115 (+) Transcript_5711:73-417(+)|eukprot:CAMPEP_0177647702 /NCGR_PEP_ID=MMETSP0447-20121125/10442_1 /TAXON_ID=0 /ORGANISM="Stygamoeba regulata, Strain BSH-02190019" /LENGTH=114 /DNA_ID=CAMNT_0019150307 /DNA_START=682 /DNA_END=1029 /DNA_ORIENTATION=-